MELLYDFLSQAVEADASDIHLKPGQPPIYRLDGVLAKADAPALSSEDMFSFLNEILTPHLKEQYEKDQEVDFAWNFNDIARFRANLFASGGEPTLSLRYVKSAIHTFASLNLPPVLETIARAPRGIVLSGGTTGSGKSTTLAAMIQYINDHMFRRIITIEDPIEYLFEDQMSIISQREVGFDTPAFPTGLRNALRQDPDIIMVGEIRDRDSVETALAAAETGHLIFSTVHTDNSGQTISRILDMFRSEERTQMRLALGNTMKAIICQRLVPDKSGRVRPAVEILMNTPIVKKLISEDNLDRLSTAIETGGEDGMQSFNQSLYEMVQEGHIDEDVALAHASNVESLRMNLKGIFLDTSSRIVGS